MDFAKKIKRVTRLKNYNLKLKFSNDPYGKKPIENPIKYLSILVGSINAKELIKSMIYNYFNFKLKSYLLIYS